MVTQGQNTPNAYDQFKQKFAQYAPYLIALKDFQEKQDIRGLKKLAVDNAPDTPEKQRVSKSNDVQVISRFFNVGSNRTKKDFEEFGDGNLKQILEKTPKRNLETILISVELKDQLSGSHASAFKDHQEYQKMYRNLAVFSDKESEEEDKENALNEMKKKVIGFYESNYGNDADLLDALKYLSQIDEEINVIRYSMFTEEKGKEFKDKVGQDFAPYLSSAAEDKLGLYSLIATDFKKRK